MGLQWSPDGKQLLATGCCSASGGLSVIDFPSGRTTSLADGKVIAALWQPDGYQIAYTLEGVGGVSLVTADGTGRGHIDADVVVYPAAWSPDSMYLALTSNFGHDLTVVFVPGPPRQTLAVTGFAWAPQGHQLAYTTDAGLFVLDAQAGVSRQVASGQSDGGVTWSPDGSRIAFKFGPRSAFVHGPSENTAQDYYVVAADGNSTPLPLTPLARTVAWSPDGKQLAYISEGCVTGIFDIYRVQLDSMGTTQMSVGSNSVDGLSWAPVGSQIMYHEPNRLTLADLSGGNSHTLAEGDPAANSEVLQGSWSADGRYVLFGMAAGAHGTCD
jgi:Tol biopolymer transport system component